MDSWLHISIITRGTADASTHVYFNSSTYPALYAAVFPASTFVHRPNPEPLQVQLHMISWGGVPFIPAGQQMGSWSSMLPFLGSNRCSKRLDRTFRPWDPVQPTAHRISSIHLTASWKPRVLSRRSDMLSIDRQRRQSPRRPTPS